MPTLRKTSFTSFVLDESKLTRTLTVVAERFSAEKLTPELQLKVEHKNGLTIETRDAQEVLSLDNAVKNRIVRLTASFQTPGEKETPTHVCYVDFDDKNSTNVELEVRCKDSKWARETFSAVDEQLDRTLVSEPFFGALSFRMLPFLMMFALVGVLLLFLILDSRSWQKMWLPGDALARAERVLHDPTIPDQSKVVQILGLQIGQLVEAERQSLLQPGRLLSLRGLFLFGPLTLVLAASFYCLLTCYPGAVFRWGDWAGHYDALLSKRTRIWNGIIWGMLVGVVGNLFVYGYGMKPDR